MKLQTATILAGAGLLTWLVGCGSDSFSGSSSIESSQAHAVDVSNYADGASCKECHPSEWEEWNTSNHARAEILLGETVDVTETGLDGGQNKFPAVRQLGVEPLVQYSVEINGNLQVAQHAFDPHEKDWFDIFDDGRGPGEWGHWTGRGMSWDSMCARCHNTHFEKKWDPSTDLYQSSLEETGIACESCHPNASAHANDPEVQAYSNTNDPTESCAPCHSRRAELGPIDEVGTKRVGNINFLDNYSPELPDLSDTWHADGRIRDEDYEWVSFRLSRLHQAGVSCIDCHNPHSTATKLPGDALCMSCHAEVQGEIPIIQINQHTNHPQESSGARCVGCHMPTTTYMQRDPRHDHSFTIPDPQLSKELGLRNACNDCHQDQNVDWSQDWVEEWYGNDINHDRRKRARLLQRARLVHNGESDDLSGWQQLLAHLKDEPNAMWRAVLTSALSAWPAGEEVFPHLLNSLADEEPLVRLAAVRALGQELIYMFPRVQDGVDFYDAYKAVRVEAGLALGPFLKESSKLNQEINTFFQHNRDQPPGAASYGTWLKDRGLFDDAIAEFERAIKWDSGQPVLYEAYAAALDAAGKSEEAYLQSELITQRWPDYANGWFLYGLAKGMKQEWQAAEHALGRSLQINPTQSRAWYNLAIIRNEMGKTSSAIDAVQIALQHAPQDVEIQNLLKFLTSKK